MEVPSFRFRPLSAVIVLLVAVTSALEDVTELLCAHHNWTLDREKAAREMSADIERIVAGE